MEYVTVYHGERKKRKNVSMNKTKVLNISVHRHKKKISHSGEHT